MDCIFCKIANKEFGSLIYEDENSIVTLDINPKADGHLLLMPKKHIKDIKNLDENTLLNLNKVKIKMIELLETKLSCNGITILNNYGSAQEVKHFHIHIIPRYENDNMHLNKKDYQPKDLEEIKNILTN